MKEIKRLNSGSGTPTRCRWHIRYHPDFSFRDPETGQLIYYEHFGLSDNPGYYEKSTVERLMDYWYEGIRLGENLIITFETKDDPLTAGRVQAALDSFFGKRASYIKNN